MYIIKGILCHKILCVLNKIKFYAIVTHRDDVCTLCVFAETQKYDLKLVWAEVPSL